MKFSKRKKTILEKIDVMKTYALQDAISLLKGFPKLKFSETVDLVLKWYENFYQDNNDMKKISINQIKYYNKILLRK